MMPVAKIMQRDCGCVVREQTGDEPVAGTREVHDMGFTGDRSSRWLDGSSRTVNRRKR